MNAEETFYDSSEDNMKQVSEKTLFENNSSKSKLMNSDILKIKIKRVKHATNKENINEQFRKDKDLHSVRITSNNESNEVGSLFSTEKEWLPSVISEKMSVNYPSGCIKNNIEISFLKTLQQNPEDKIQSTSYLEKDESKTITNTTQDLEEIQVYSLPVIKSTSENKKKRNLSLPNEQETRMLLPKIKIKYSECNKTNITEHDKISGNKSQFSLLLSKDNISCNKKPENTNRFSVFNNEEQIVTLANTSFQLANNTSFCFDDENDNIMSRDFYIPFLKTLETPRFFPNIVNNLECSKRLTEIIMERIIAVILEWMRRKETSKIILNYLMKVSLQYDSYEKYFNTYFQLLMLDLLEFINQSSDEYKNNQFDAIILETSVTELWCIKCKMLTNKNFHVNDLICFQVVTILENMQKSYKFGFVAEHLQEDFQWKSTENNSNNKYLIKILKQYGLVLAQGVRIRISLVCSITNFIQQCEALVSLKQSSLLKYVLEPDFECCRIDTATENRLAASNQYTSCQRNAIINISHTLVQSNNRCIIMLQTPPGTGKCQTVAGIIQQILLQLNNKSKILVLSLSERSIKEIGQKLNDLNNENIRLVCIGKHQKNFVNLKPFCIEEIIQRNVNKMFPAIVNYLDLVQNLKSEIIINANVVLTTTDNLNSEFTNFRNGFTCCIVYDSTQLTELQNLIPLQFGIEKLLLVGDPQQFSASLLTKAAYEYGFHVSLFERFFNYFETLTDKSPVLMLSLQYCINPSIISFPSSYFYSNNLKSANVSSELPILPYCVIDLIDVKSEESSILETKFVAELWDGISKIIPKDKTVGIVTKYKYQRDTIRDILIDKDKYSHVISVYSFEGLCKCPIFDIVIVLYSAPREEENYKLLNILLTRAKSSLILCGYLTIMSNHHFWDRLIQDARRRKIFFRLPSSYSYFACEIMQTKNKLFT
ncbi:probable helicase senataxin [Centruroides vittatus]|uniref:probable helicase senataxin n=1 Tax=Centruroides vittatus TaxID=120091 RepID=UPI00350F3799